MELYLLTAPVTITVQDGPMAGDVCDITIMVPLSPVQTICVTCRSEAEDVAHELGPEYGVERV
jgi:hypothetical protein